MNSEKLVKDLTDLDLDSSIAEAERIEAEDAKRRQAAEALPALKQEQQRRQQQAAQESAADQGRTVLGQLAPRLVADLAESDKAIEEALRHLLMYWHQRRDLAQRYENLHEIAARQIAPVEWNGVATADNTALDILRRYGLRAHPLALNNSIIELVQRFATEVGLRLK